MGSVKILGVDPGTSLIGFGIIETKKGRMSALDLGAFKTPKNIPNKDRVVAIYDFFDKLIKRWRPEKVAIESLFFFKNSKTVIKVSEVRGILMLAGAKNGIEIAEFTPLQVKQAVSTYGRAGKDQVQRMVKLILGMDKEPEPDDAADALAVAVCCANTLF